MENVIFSLNQTDLSAIVGYFTSGCWPPLGLVICQASSVWHVSDSAAVHGCGVLCQLGLRVSRDLVMIKNILLYGRGGSIAVTVGIICGRGERGCMLQFS